MRCTGGTLFHYHMVSLSRLQPPRASQVGGEEISIHGHNFMPRHERLYCIFGSSGTLVFVCDNLRA